MNYYDRNGDGVVDADERGPLHLQISDINHDMYRGLDTTAKTFKLKHGGIIYTAEHPGGIGRNRDENGVLLEFSYAGITAIDANTPGGYLLVKTDGTVSVMSIAGARALDTDDDDATTTDDYFILATINATVLDEGSNGLTLNSLPLATTGAINLRRRQHSRPAGNSD